MKIVKGRNKRVMAETDVAPEAVDLLFEAEDVAQLVAEITGEDVEVTADETEVTFDVAGETFVCEAEEDSDVVESSRKTDRSMKRVAASKRPMGKAVKKLPRRK